MEDSLKKLYKKLESLQINLEEEIKKNKSKDENSYNLTKQLHHTQEAYLELNEELKMLKLENQSILKEMDFILKNKVSLERFCQEQTIEIERGIVIINDYLQRK